MSRGSAEDQLNSYLKAQKVSGSSDKKKVHSTIPIRFFLEQYPSCTDEIFNCPVDDLELFCYLLRLCLCMSSNRSTAALVTTFCPLASSSVINNYVLSYRTLPSRPQSSYAIRRLIRISFYLFCISYISDVLLRILNIKSYVATIAYCV